MRVNQKICHRVHIKLQKELEGYKRREERHIQGVPRLILGKYENNTQQIWMDQLKNQPITKLKEFNGLQKGYSIAKTIVNACYGLANYYGYFIINENMVFFNPQKEVFAWINPDLLENHIKIYLPRTQDGELAMIRSVISYLKLWYKCDYSLFSEVKRLSQLVAKFQQMKNRPMEGFKAKSPERQFLGARRNSVNLEAADIPLRYRDEAFRPPVIGKQLLKDNKSNKQICKSPGRDNEINGFLTSSISNKITPPLKFNQTNQVTQATSETEKPNTDFDHRSFNSNNNIVTPLSKSIGMGNNTYFPNKTTSSKHHIVSMINKLDTNAEFVKNKLLLDDEKLQNNKPKKMKESLDGIGEELNDLFVSNIQNEQQNEEEKKKIEEQFQNLLG